MHWIDYDIKKGRGEMIKNHAEEMYQWATDLFPINRSITGNGVRETLAYIKNIVPELNIQEIPSHTKCFDWSVPKEWNVKDAYLQDEQGNKIIDFKENNLHLVGYSIPVDEELEYDELVEHLYYLEDQPDAIPYITSYYKERWGFCLTYNQFKRMKKSKYRVKIDTELKEGALTYGEVILEGALKKEIFLSTYICHPSMANNELSGPVVAMALIDFIRNLKERKYTYRIIFIPETIGSICYLSKNLKEMQANIIAGFNLTTIGDNRSYSYIPTRYGNTLSDKVAKHILGKSKPDYVRYSFLDRGSDERQYCAPGVDLPVATICRTKFGEYPEYHTSLDNLDVISPEGLNGGYEILADTILVLEKNNYYKVNVLCEPQLGKRGLFPTLTTQENRKIVRTLIDFIAYADGTNDLIDIAEIIDVNAKELFDIIDNLLAADLLEILKEGS